MKKTLSSFLAFILCSTLLFCTVSCDELTVPTDSGSHPTDGTLGSPTENPSGPFDENSTETEVPLDGPVEDLQQEELFLRVKEALTASMAYEGPFTVKLEWEGFENEYDDDYSQGIHDLYSSTYSLDAASGKLVNANTYISYENDEPGQRQVYIEKYLIDGQNKYLYEVNASSEVGSAEEDFESCYYLLSDRSWSCAMSTEDIRDGLYDHFTESFGAPFNVSSKLELDKAYDRLIPLMASNEAKSLLSEGYAEARPTNLEYSVTLTDEEGLITMEIKVSYSAAYEKDGVTELMEVFNRGRLFVKDGRIVGFENHSMLTESEEYEGGATCWDCSSHTEYTFIYDFDNGQYDGVIDDLPTGEVERYNEYISKSLSVSINGNAPIDVHLYGELESDTDVAQLLRESLYNGLGIYDTNGIALDWYSDAEHTLPIDLSTVDTPEKLEALNTLYLKAAAEEGYALIIVTDDAECRLSTDYTTVFGKWGGGRSEGTCFYSVSVDQQTEEDRFDLHYYPDSVYDASVTVNGVEIDTSLVENGEHESKYPLSYENGKVYYAHILYTCDEDVFDLTDLFFDF